MPFPLLGFDTDNDSVFMNETVKDYCLSEKIVFTRSRPYRKNDQAWVEQKNGAVVRRAVGYRRYEGIAAAALLARLYSTSRLFVNFFQPSFKLAEKTRDGAKVRKRYHLPATPYQRLLADPRVTDEIRRGAGDVYATLDPVLLLQEIRSVSAGWRNWRTRYSPRSPPRRTRRPSISFSLDCARHGKRAMCGQRANRNRKRNVAVGGPILSLR